jgi:hypothetical protein
MVRCLSTLTALPLPSLILPSVAHKASEMPNHLSVLSYFLPLQLQNVSVLKSFYHIKNLLLLK